jgi:hypothetical protein
MTTAIIHTDQAEAVAAVWALHDKGRAATLVSNDRLTRWAAVDLDGPIVDVTDTLFELGWDTVRAEDEAMRLVGRGF